MSMSSLCTTPLTAEQILEAALMRSIRAAWRAHLRSGESVTPAQHAVYALLRRQSLDKTFTPCSDPGRLQARGGNPHRCREESETAARALACSAWKPFAALLEGTPTRHGWAYEATAHPLFQRLGA